MKQYREIKRRHLDAILLFRMGDFYEMFDQDAVTASKVLEITLTARNKSKGIETPLCGFPIMRLTGILPSLSGGALKWLSANRSRTPSSPRVS